MGEKQDITRNIAKIISIIFHPYVVLSLVVSIIAYQVSSSPDLWIKWTMVILLPAYLLPFLYMQAAVYVINHTTGRQVNRHTFFREQPTQMALLACLFGIPSAAILYLLDYPASILATLLGIAATSLVIALVNRAYRASFHLGSFTSASISLITISGLPPVVVIPFIALLGTARYHLGEHTPLQLTTGFMIGLMVTTAVLRGFGIL